MIVRSFQIKSVAQKSAGWACSRVEMNKKENTVIFAECFIHVPVIYRLSYSNR